MKLNMDNIMSIKNITKSEFLTENRISESDWDLANLDFELLKQIGMHHENRADDLNKEAEYIAAKLQKIPEVHSVRWRVKDSQHLMEKIVRKRKLKSQKYSNINIDNYNKVITDLIGVRVLHLFKDEWNRIHNEISDLWNLKEKVVAYIRSGDEKDLINGYKAKKCKVEIHKDAYRSIHYIISSEATKNKILCEIQVRTIFEEGWSEIDHKIRYPNFLNNPVVSYYLRIFNRMAGSADEMGTFIKILSADMERQSEIINESNKEQERQNREITKLIGELNKSQLSKEDNAAIIKKLEGEIQKLNKRPTQFIDPTAIFATTFGMPFPNAEIYEQITSEALLNQMTLPKWVEDAINRGAADGKVPTKKESPQNSPSVKNNEANQKGHKDKE